MGSGSQMTTERSDGQGNGTKRASVDKEPKLVICRCGGGMRLIGVDHYHCYFCGRDILYGGSRVGKSEDHRS